MEWNNVLSGGYENVLKTLERALDGLSEDDLNWQPNPECNSIGWLVWHLTRVQDGLISSSMGEEQLWIKDGWHAKFGRRADAQDVGAGHTPKDLARFKSPGASVLLDYHRAVMERSKRFFATLSKVDLDKEFKGPMSQPPRNIGTILIMTLSDNLQHAGQVAYIRGLRQGMGWQKF